MIDSFVTSVAFV